MAMTIPYTPSPEWKSLPQYTPGRSAAERLKEFEALTREVVETQRKLTQGILGGGHSVKMLWNCVNRYVDKKKETWETMLRSLLDSPAGYLVDEVWAWEAVQHGDSALINAHNLSGISDWMDDRWRWRLCLLVSNVLPESTSEARKEHGYRTRKVVMVGHSFGGCTSLRAAVDFPKLFSSVVLVDAAIVQPYTYPPDYYDRVLGAISRRSRWTCREDALKQFKKSPFFCTWNPEVLQLYVDHGLTDDSNGGVKLKMSGVHEGLCFVNYLASWEMWELLDKVDEAIMLRWIVPEEGFVGEEATRVRVWRRPANSSRVIFHSFSHLIVQEAPVELAQDMSRFLLRNYGSTRAHL
ncbi:Alpha/Beta hydrolase protein [Melanogaster broomeanus]|nr:Alpha/Beta hydrolase protein [Melanogaster broomeanus]